MTGKDIIKQVEDEASEYLEMSDNPAALVAGILANKIIKLKDHIEYLEKRLNYVSSSTNSRS